MEKPCLQCGTIIKKKQNCSIYSWFNRVKYCSMKCLNEYRRGKPSASPETTFKKGHISVVPYESRRRGEQNYMWKGGQIKKKCLICKSAFSVDSYRKNAKTCSLICNRKYRQSNEFRNRLSKIQRSLTPKIFVSTRKLRSLLRRCSIYNRWRNKVFARDNYTCRVCGIRGGKLHADHIRPFIIIMFENNVNTYEDAVKCKKLWNIRNGRTLCKPCHYKTDTFGAKVYKTFTNLLNH